MSGRGGYQGGGGGFRGAKQIYRPPSGIPPLNTRVMNLENALTSSLSLGNLSLTERTFPQRPGFGTQGRRVAVWANFVELLADPALVLHTYSIDVEPKATGRKLARIWKLFLDGPDCAALRGKIATDFKLTMVSFLKVPEANFNVSYPPVYHIHVRYTNELPVAAFLAYLDPNLSTGNYHKAPIIQALNIVLNHYSKSADGLVTVGSRIFPLDSNKSITDLGSGLQAIRGFYSSLRAATGRILVNVKVSYGVFFQPGPLHNLMKLVVPNVHQNKYKLDISFKGVNVKLTHLSKRNKSGREIPRIKTILGLASDEDGKHSSQRRPRVRAFGAGPKDVEFWLEDQNRYISVYEFFRCEHGIELKHVDLPVINVGSQDHPTYLPPEVCEVLSGQSARRVGLNGPQTTRMLGAAVHKPYVNAQTIVNIGLQAVGLGPKNILQDSFHLRINSSLITAPARVLPEPRVFYSKKPAKLNQSRAWNVLGQNLTAPATIRAWGWLVVAIQGMDASCGFSGEPDLMNTLKAFHRVMNNMGIGIGPPKTGRRIVLSRLGDKTLDKELTVAAGTLDFLYIILPDKTPVYNRIKHICDVKLGLINVCCIGQKLRENDEQYFRNVALKINAKCGGYNQAIEPARLHLIAQDKTMVVGIDVTHPSPSSSKYAPSIAGMVASVDKHMGQWPSLCKVQLKSRQEMVSGLKDMLKSRLFLWKTRGNHDLFPENIIVFRDGVSEGQYQMVKQMELPLLRQACDEVYSAADQAKPRITIVIVTKRHHKRFYPTTEETSDNGSNCMAGTVIDQGITEARSWDFCIIPHTALKGTAKPTYYFVVHDEIFVTAHRGNNLSPADTLEDVTQSLSYISARSTKPVSICAPADYADLVCERARCYLSRFFDPSAQSDRGMPQSSGREDDESRQAYLQRDISLYEKVEDMMVYI
ncbi:Protein argonaute 12 [Cytospora mali]|uniref:Protein argonaute 12 n=1 Tax=Cytospora mali TaxID=578113 RepID=A0A194UY65_CYTMA|nr:Protein argonaute 12 [Valsa mali var. pyri (nom. inval.)]